MGRDNMLRKMAEFQPDKTRQELEAEYDKQKQVYAELAPDENPFTLMTAEIDESGWRGPPLDFMAIVADNQAMEDKGMYFDGNHWRWRKSWIRRLLHLPEPKRLKYV